MPSSWPLAQKWVFTFVTYFFDIAACVSDSVSDRITMASSWKIIALNAILLIAFAAAQMDIFCDLSQQQLVQFMDCGKDGFSAEASNGWSSCKENILKAKGENVTDVQALTYMCQNNKTRTMEECMKKSGKKVNRRAKARMMVCMMKIIAT